MADDEYDPDALDAKEEEDDDSVSQQDRVLLRVCCACCIAQILPQLPYICIQPSIKQV
jgi:hypothetical protein